MLKPNIAKLVSAAEQTDRFTLTPTRVYVEIDGIRLVFDDGDLVGWYRPGAWEDNNGNPCD